MYLIGFYLQYVNTGALDPSDSGKLATTHEFWELNIFLFNLIVSGFITQSYIQNRMKCV